MSEFTSARLVPPATATTRATRSRWWSVAAVGWVGFFAMAVWMSRSGEPTTLDNTVLAAIVAVRTSALNVAATTLTALGSFRVVAPVAAVIAGVLVWRTRNLQWLPRWLSGAPVGWGQSPGGVGAP